MDANRKNRYSDQTKKEHTALKLIAVFVSAALLSAGIVFALSFVQKDAQTASAEPSSAQDDSDIKSESATESREESKTEEEVSKELRLKSGLPDYSNDFKYTEKLIENGSLDDDISSKYAVLYDTESDTILYTKNADEKCYPASTTKLLTAVVAYKLLDMDELISVGDEITLIGEDSSIAGLEVGQKLTGEQLLYAMLLPSGNDAAYTIAVNAAKSFKNDDTLTNEEAIEVFSKLMNDAAKELGAENSHFVTPDGFHDDNHYTTALDIIKIANYAKSIPLISEICKTYQTTLTLDSGEELYLINSNKLLSEEDECFCEYADGLKTGYTDEAGSCVIASFTKDGKTFLTAAMASSELYGKYYDSLMLSKLGFNHSGIDFDYIKSSEE